ncbi:HlyD family secretion protein [Nevskia soli]|uniref:HlyD family secretion protein n=1 Tax=Nevskia soli TaxID=418856 RepID=UPI0004A74D16|nr:HlyD family efflux transporter periplasmic adaptor subunit [Nevskia soli]
MNRFDRNLALAAILAAAAAFSGCSRSEPAAAPLAAANDIVATAPGWVDVQGGTQRLAARIDGIVQSIAIRDGDTVAAGELLLRLDDRQAQTEKQLAEVELQRRRQERDALGEQLKRAQEEAARLAPLVAQQAEPEDELRQARQKVTALQTQAGLAKLAAQAAVLQLQQVQDKLKRLELRAPAHGQVLRVFVHAGEAVGSGSQLVWFAGDGPLIVRAELDERLFGQVLPGMTAEVAPEYDNSKVYTARVLRVARSVGPVHELPEVRPAAKDDRVVECVLDLGTADLLIGQRVLVRVRSKP